MKGSAPIITLLGNNSGRNLGDAAILSSIMESLSRELPGSRFLVPTIAPDWVKRHYGSLYDVEAVNVMPWTLSIRLLGLPTIRCLAKSDAALICDGIIFGKKLLNPAFNYLITLIFLAPLAALFKCKLVCFNCGIGPFPSRFSRWCAKWVINHCDLVMMREADSAALAKDVGVTRPIELTGDSAFINPVSSRERAQEVCRAEGIDLARPLLGLNITRYLDTWLEPHERVGATDLIAAIADGVRSVTERLAEKPQVVVFCTQPMDEVVSHRLAKMLGAAYVGNSTYLSHDIQAVMRECRVLVGMRFHSLILASAVGVPIVGLIYAPKVRGYMRLLGAEHLGLELAELTPETLAGKLEEAWIKHEAVREAQQKVIDKLRDGAHRAARLLRETVSPSD